MNSKERMSVQDQARAAAIDYAYGEVRGRSGHNSRSYFPVYEPESELH